MIDRILESLETDINAEFQKRESLGAIPLAPVIERGSPPETYDMLQLGSGRGKVYIYDLGLLPKEEDATIDVDAWALEVGIDVVSPDKSLNLYQIAATAILDNSRRDGLVLYSGITTISPQVLIDPQDAPTLTQIEVEIVFQGDIE